MSEGDELPDSDVELPVVHELTTLEQLRAVSDPLRIAIFRLLREREQTVKDLCETLNESSTRLYYHVGELERVGLVRLVRTETKAGVVHKYYRSVAQFLNVPTSLLDDTSGSPEAAAAIEWFSSMLDLGSMDVRQAFGDKGFAFDRSLIFVTRNYIRTTPDRAREFVRRLEELQAEFLSADDEDATFRVTFTASFVPTPRFLTSPSRRAPRSVRSGRRSGSVAVRQSSRGHAEPGCE